MAIKPTSMTYAPSLVTHEELLSLGFSHNPGPLLNDYTLDISWWPGKHFKQLSLDLNPGNIYVYLREQGTKQPNSRLADSIVCVFNQDLQGTLTKEWLEALISLIKI